MSRELIREALQDFAKEGVSSHISSWDSIQRNLTTASKSVQIDSNRAPSADRPLAVFRSNLSLAAILISLLLVGGVFAFLVSRNDTAPGVGLSSSNIIAALQTQPVSHTVNGYTISLYPFYASEGWLSIAYIVSDTHGNKLPLYALTEDGMYFYHGANPMERKIAPLLVDMEGHHYPMLGVGPNFAWSAPATESQRMTITEIEAHRLEGQQGQTVCCLNAVDVVVWNFDPLLGVTKNDPQNMHLELTVFLPAGALGSSASESSSSSGVLDIRPSGYKDIVQARMAFDFLLPAK